MDRVVGHESIQRTAADRMASLVQALLQVAKPPVALAKDSAESGDEDRLCHPASFSM
jgi:hypothetical protein